MADALNRLERNVLKIKGVSEEMLDAIGAAGISSRADFAVVGDAATLCALVPGLKPALAEIVMAWAQGRPAPAAAVAAAAAGAPAAAPVLLAAAPPSASASAAPSAASAPAATAAAKPAISLAPPDIICTHCRTKQPKGRKYEEMCAACGQRLISPEAAASATKP